jgi:hypothetical protein
MNTKHKICFVVDTHYPNYTARLKSSSLKQYIDLNLAERGIDFLISTNRPQDFKEYNQSGITVYDIDELRKNNQVSLDLELLPEDPTGIYPGRFPWNMERFVLKQAGTLGYNIVINIDADVVIHPTCDGDYLENHLNKIYEPNTLFTNQALFYYEEGSTREVFSQHDQYKKHFNLNYSADRFTTCDDPVLVYMGATNNDIVRYAEAWDVVATFGYKKEFGFGYESMGCGTRSLVLPMTDFKLKWHELCFVPHHVYEDRY